MVKTTAKIFSDEDGRPTTIEMKGIKLTLNYDSRGILYSILSNKPLLLSDILSIANSKYIEKIGEIITPQTLHLSEWQTLPWWVKYSQKPIYIDDFESLLKWSTLSGTVAKDTTVAFEQTTSLKLTTGAIADLEAIANIDLGYPERQRISIETWIRFNQGLAATLQRFGMVFYCYNGTEVRTFGIAFLNYLATVEQQKWQYWTADGGWLDIPDGSQAIDMTLAVWHYLRFIFDLKKSCYISLEFDGKIYDLSKIYPAVIGSSQRPLMRARLYASTDTTTATVAYHDAVAIGIIES